MEVKPKYPSSWGEDRVDKAEDEANMQEELDNLI